MRNYTWLLLLLAGLLVPLASAQESLIELPVTPRVDTTDADVRAVYRLWRRYLSSQPDSLYDNPYWSKAEKADRHDFDLSRKWTYGYDVIGRYGRANVHDIYDIQARVLSIDRKAHGFAIRTLYLPADPRFGMITVQRVNARRENENWRLYSALPEVTSDWKRYTVGEVEYIVDPAHEFDDAKAEATAAFVDSLRRTFELDDEPPLTFYLASTREAMAQAMGLDFTWDPSHGRAYPRDRLLFRGDGSEWNPHEVAHAVFGAFDLTHVILEGLATYLGGMGDRTFEIVAADVGKELSENDVLTLDDVIHGRTASSTMFYGTGAILVDAVIEDTGVEGVRRFLSLSSTPEGVYNGLSEVLRMSKEEADTFWRTRARFYMSQ